MPNLFNEKEVLAILMERDRLRLQVTELQADNTRLVERERVARAGGILSGPAIRDAVARGDIEIDPYEPAHLNPASIDLTLGPKVLVARGFYQSEDPNQTYETRQQYDWPELQRYDERSIVLEPGELYIMHTAERVCTRRYVPVLDGKSSVGRIGVQIHITAGYGDPGFDGQYTLEVTSVYRVRVYVGMRFCQMRFHTLAGEPADYQKSGHYVGEASRGPVPSMIYKQFEGK